MEKALKSLLERLDVTQVEEEVTVVKDAVTMIQRLSVLLVDILEKTKNGYWVGSELIPIARVVGPFLVSRLQSSTDLEFRCFAAILLLDSDRELGTNTLLRLLDEGGEVCLIAGALGVKGIKSAIPTLERLLRQYDAIELNIDPIICLVTALERLEGSIPEDVTAKFSKPESPWQVRALLEQIKQKSTEK